MSESPTTLPEKSSTQIASRISWAILIVATLYVCYFSHLGAIGFVGPDEPRYAWIARAMTETGDWVTPRLYGKPWFEKPPLYYWEAALSFKVFGVSEAAARLPSAISALLATLALAWLGLRMYGEETARWLLLLLPTTVGMIGFSHAAATDMPFSGMLTIAMVCGAMVLRLDTGFTNKTGHGPPKSPTPWVVLLLFGFFMGLAVLAKGPAGIILCGGAVFFWAIFTKRWRDAFRLLHPAAIAAFGATALPWYILCARRNPDFFRIFIIEHNFKRFLTPEFRHIQPFWFYSAVLAVALLPWTALALWGAFVGSAQIWRSRRLSPYSLFLLAWALFCIVFFTISKSKLPGYILPAIPPIGLLMAVSRITLAGGKTRSLAMPLLVLSLFLVCCLVLVGFLAPHVSQGNPRFGIAVGVILGALALANFLLGTGVSLPAKSWLGRGLAACCVLPVLFAVSITGRLAHSFFLRDPSGRTLSQELRRRAIPTAELTLVKPFGRGQLYSLSFYLHEEVAERDRKHPQEGYVLTAGRYSKSELGSEFTLQQIPFDLDRTGFFLYRIEKQSPASSGKLH